MTKLHCNDVVKRFTRDGFLRDKLTVSFYFINYRLKVLLRQRN